MPPKKKPVEDNPDTPTLDAAENPSIVFSLIDALKDSTVAQTLGKALAPYIDLAVDEAVKKSLTQVHQRLDKLAADNKLLKKQNDELIEENNGLKTRLIAVEERLEIVDRHQRNNTLILYGIPEGGYAEKSTEGADINTVSTESHVSVQETVANVLIDADSQLSDLISSQTIVAAYRIKKGSSDTHRPVLIKFSTQKARNSIFSARKELRKKNIFISEHLTKTAFDLFYKARQLRKQKTIHDTWTRNGQVFIKVSNVPTCKPKAINNEDDLPRH